jgi:hypothetical protein
MKVLPVASVAIYPFTTHVNIDDVAYSSFMHRMQSPSSSTSAMATTRRCLYVDNENAHQWYAKGCQPQAGIARSRAQSRVYSM